MKAPDPAAIGAEIAALTARLGESTGPEAAAEAQRLVQLVMSFYGAGLARVLEIARAERRGPQALLEAFEADPLVASLFALHDLEPRLQTGGLLQIHTAPTSHGTDAAAGREDHCQLCAAPLPAEHPHLVDIERRRLLCACSICSAVGGRYRRVPTRYVHESVMSLTSDEWDLLGVPVGLVFFVVNSHLNRTLACYPGPAGATESLLPLETWPALVERHEWLQQLAPDVEALLVRRTAAEYRCYIVPVDACYELVGRIRRGWTGFGGGQALEREIDRFFAEIADKAARQREVPA